MTFYSTVKHNELKNVAMVLRCWRYELSFVKSNCFYKESSFVFIFLLKLIVTLV